MSDIPDGYGVIAGRSRKNAQAALDAAEKAGVPGSEVVAVAEGYLVPVSVLDAFHGAHSDDSADESDAPTSDWKNADIRDWAEAQGVDLDGATTKADMLAAIAAADEKE